MSKGTKALFSIAIGAYKSIINKAESHWEALHPKSFNGYTLCKNGISLYISQLNIFIQTRTKFMTGNTLASFNRKELSIFRTFPSTMVKSMPILVLFSLPGSMLIMPLLFLFPRTLLTPNFWTADQKSDYFQRDLQLRWQYVDRVEHDFIRQLHKFQSNSQLDDDLVGVCMRILSGGNNNDIHELIPIFENYLPINALPLSYAWHLRKCYPIPANIFLASREKLRRFGAFLAYEDSHLQKENLNELPSSDLFELCLTRGINPYAHQKEELVEYLNLWLANSCKAKVENHSFRLHLIVLISNEFRKKSKQKAD